LLLKRGVNLEQCRIEAMGFQACVGPAAFQKALQGDMGQDLYSGDIELIRLMAYAEHLTNEVLGENQWRWRKNFIEKKGVYEIATDQPVEHRKVRKWLKSTGRHAGTRLFLNTNMEDVGGNTRKNFTTKMKAEPQLVTYD